MGPFEIKEMEKSINTLIAFARKGDVLGRGAYSIYVVAIGAPALNYLTRKLDLALLELEPNVALTLSRAIVNIWETDAHSPLVAKSREKVRALLSHYPPKITPSITHALSELRQSLGVKPCAHASERFLAGPGVFVSISGKKNMPRITICRN